MLSIDEMEKEGIPILEVKDLSKSFGELEALKEVNFDVKKREVFGIVGPNGAGKTTLFNIVTGVLPGKGDIIFDGRNINGLRPHRVCQEGISRTFQSPPYIFSTMTVLENVSIGARFGVRRSLGPGTSHEQDVRKAIDFLGLRGKENNFATSLSLFDRKKTMLAASLATRPKLLLLDEPMSGLSPAEVEETKGLIQRVNKEEGISIIVIEHLLEVILEICKRVMVLSTEVIDIRPSEDVMESERVKEVYLKV